ncbi:MAG: LPS assembly protein LptD [Gammaproteobacteria bacterium]|nr:LPS assembly protein LptD [Gammaproteobacteria bacterium]
MPRITALVGRALALALSLGGCLLPSAPRAAEPPPEAASCVQQQFTGVFGPVSASDKVDIHADSVQLQNNGLSNLNGSVRISQSGREFVAQSLHFDATARTIQADQPSLFRDHQLVVQSDRAKFDLDRGIGDFSGTHFTLLDRHSRGGAEALHFSQSGQAELRGAEYTSCAPGDDAWLLQAGSIKLDRVSGLGVARNAVLRVRGVPILWLPYFRFPIDNRRRSGLLFPTIGESSKTGFDARWPLYLNLAPNFDDTFTPRVTSRRGTLLDNVFRYLLPGNRGSFEYNFLNKDHEDNELRSFIHFQHQGILVPHLALNVDFAQVSDRNFFSTFGGNDVGNAFIGSSTPFLPRQATLTYQPSSNFSLQALGQSFQPLTVLGNRDDVPYKREPEIRLDTITANSLWQTRAGLNGDFTNFKRSSSTEGERLYLDPYLRWQVDHLSWFANAQADYTYTRYQLTFPEPQQSRAPQRQLPMLSADFGSRFNHVTDSGWLQTLEPEVQYLYVPFRNQDQLPNFDAGQPDFDLSQLFARNRFSGEDRIADAKQITTALTTRLLDPATGLVRLTASVGETYRFTAPTVSLPDAPQPSAGFSNLLTFFDFQFNAHWDARSSTETNPRFDSIRRADIDFRFHDDRHVLDLAYRYRQGLLQQTDVSVLTPLIGNWKIAGRLQYSLRFRNTVSSFAGLQYDSCCWSAQVAYRRFLSNDAPNGTFLANTTSSRPGRFSNGIFLQFEFKGLGRIGRGFESELGLNDQKHETATLIAVNQPAFPAPKNPSEAAAAAAAPTAAPASVSAKTAPKNPPEAAAAAAAPTAAPASVSAKTSRLARLNDWEAVATNAPPPATPAPAAAATAPAAQIPDRTVAVVNPGDGIEHGLHHTPQMLDRIVAVVNDGVILRSELDQAIVRAQNDMRSRGISPPSADALQGQVLEQLILIKVQTQRAEQDGLKVDDNALNSAAENIAQRNGMSLEQFTARLATEGIDLASFRDQVRDQILIARVREKEVIPRIQVTEQDVDLYLANQGANSDREYRLAHILIAVPDGADAKTRQARRDKAEKLDAALKAGADFTQAAIANSDDPQALQGGDLGWRKFSQLPTLFESVLPQMKPGQVSDVLEDANGFHIVKLEDTRDAGQRQTVEETHVEHILLAPNAIRDDDASKALAEQLYQKIVAGADFATLAKQYTDDTGSKAQGGDLGWQPPGVFVPEFQQHIDALQPGQVSRPFRSKFGWHIVKVLGRRTQDVTEQAIRARARQTIAQRREQEEYQSWLRRLRDSAFVDIRLQPDQSGTAATDGGETGGQPNAER